MKTTVLLALFFLLSAFPVVYAGDINYAQAQGALNDGNDYLAIFSIDYTDSLFENGYLYEFSSTIAMPDTMPFRMTWIWGPLELGQVSLRFSLQNDVEVFRGGVIWMGTGKITIPDTSFSPKFFSRSSQNVPIPDSFSRFDNDLIYPAIDSICSNITYAWERIANLNLVHSLMARKYHVAFYLYPPKVGHFNPAYAKIMIFIYAARLDEVSLLATGHPAHRHVIRSEHTGRSPVCGNIYNLRGVRISQGRIAPPGGIYIKDNRLILLPSKSNR